MLLIETNWLSPFVISLIKGRRRRQLDILKRRSIDVECTFIILKLNDWCSEKIITVGIFHSWTLEGIRREEWVKPAFYFKEKVEVQKWAPFYLNHVALSSIFVWAVAVGIFYKWIKRTSFHQWALILVIVDWVLNKSKMIIRRRSEAPLRLWDGESEGVADNCATHWHFLKSGIEDGDLSSFSGYLNKRIQVIKEIRENGSLDS